MKHSQTHQAKRMRLYRQNMTEEQREQQKAYQKAYREAQQNAEKLKAYHREWELKNKKRRQEHRHRSYLKRKASGKIAAYEEARKKIFGKSVIEDLIPLQINGASDDEMRVYLKDKGSGTND